LSFAPIESGERHLIPVGMLENLDPLPSGYWNWVELRYSRSSTWDTMLDTRVRLWVLTLVLFPFLSQEWVLLMSIYHLSYTFRLGSV
jgi:hypothetical protein